MENGRYREGEGEEKKWWKGSLKQLFLNFFKPRHTWRWEYFLEAHGSVQK
jgi:hypothetical protein